jgi:predicted nuclease of predicted toxin-antitoxin system
MKLLADESVELGIVRLLRENDHDVRAVAEEHPRASDRAVLELAFAEERILVTNDKDFAG